jgi:general secretion pathway protein G
MRARRATGLIALLVLAASLGSPAALGAAKELKTLSYLPADSLLVVSTRLDTLATPYDTVLELARDFLPPEELDSLLNGLAEWEASVGLSLREDVLALLGREFAFAIAIEDLDRLGAQVMTLSPENPPNVEEILGGLVLILGVEDPDRFDASLGKLLALVDGNLAMGDDGIRTMSFPMEGQAQALDLLHYRYHKGFAVMGFGRQAVSDTVARAKNGDGLLSSAAYQEVFSHLDPDPDAIAYLNLARLQEMLRASSLLKVLIASDETMRKAYGRFVEDLDWGSGMGFASYTIPEGTIWQGFAPFDMATLTNLYMGMMAGVAIPNFVVAVDRGKQKRTVADIRSIGIAVEAYAVDHGRYPPNVMAPTPVAGAGDENLERHLAPVYIRELPVMDGWGNPILYSSDADGSSYVIYSAGKDGQLAPETVGAVQGFDGDLIYKNGHFIAWPEGMEP